MCCQDEEFISHVSETHIVALVAVSQELIMRINDDGRLDVVRLDWWVLMPILGCLRYVGRYREC